MLIDTRLLRHICPDHSDIRRRDEIIIGHHEALMLGVAHALWWSDHEACKMNLQIYIYIYTYLDSHDRARRREQMQVIADRVRAFNSRFHGVHIVINASGDRNFVVKPSQHCSSVDSNRALLSWKHGATC